MNELKFMVGSVELNLKGKVISDSNDHGIIIQKYKLEGGEGLELIRDDERTTIAISN